MSVSLIPCHPVKTHPHTPARCRSVSPGGPLGWCRRPQTCTGAQPQSAQVAHWTADHLRAQQGTGMRPRHARHMAHMLMDLDVTRRNAQIDHAHGGQDTRPPYSCGHQSDPPKCTFMPLSSVIHKNHLSRSMPLAVTLASMAAIHPSSASRAALWPGWPSNLKAHTQGAHLKGGRVCVGSS